MERLEAAHGTSTDPSVSTASRLPSVPQTRVGATGLLRRGGTTTADQYLVSAMLTWCSQQFGTPRPRFVRLLTEDSWIVQTVVQDKVVVQPADWAEIAMTWTVGLSRRPLRVTRPRVSAVGSDGLRPIAVTNYIGIPVLCRDQLVGVIEMAGQILPDVELALARAEERLSRFAERLIHDASLRAEALITADTECEIAGGLATVDRIVLTPEEWDFVSVLDVPMRLEDLAAKSGIDEERLPEIARSLVRRGLIALRTPTRLLTSTLDFAPDDHDAVVE